eukprot:scaffold60557_cov48-Phaeocystis_antarctica.AAC.2
MPALLNAWGSVARVEDMLARAEHAGPDQRPLSRSTSCSSFEMVDAEAPDEAASSISLSGDEDSQPPSRSSSPMAEDSTPTQSDPFFIPLVDPNTGLDLTGRNAYGFFVPLPARVDAVPPPETALAISTLAGEAAAAARLRTSKVAQEAVAAEVRATVNAAVDAAVDAAVAQFSHGADPDVDRPSRQPSMALQAVRNAQWGHPQYGHPLPSGGLGGEGSPLGIPGCLGMGGDGIMGGMSLSSGFGMHGQQPPPDLMLTSIEEAKQRELLRGLQLTRDFLRTLQQAPQRTLVKPEP